MKNLIAVVLFLFALPFITSSQTTPVEKNTDASHKTYKQEKEILKTATVKTDNMEGVLILLNGKEIPKEQMNDIAPESIESISVIKKDEKIEELGYSPKEIKGIIDITAKE